MITPRTALLLCLPGTVYRYKWSERERDRGFEAIVPAVQFWPCDRFWLLAGAGLGMDAPAFYDIKNEAERKFYFGGAALAGAGYQIFQHAEQICARRAGAGAFWQHKHTGWQSKGLGFQPARWVQFLLSKELRPFFQPARRAYSLLNVSKSVRCMTLVVLKKDV